MDTFAALYENVCARPYANLSSPSITEVLEDAHKFEFVLLEMSMYSNLLSMAEFTKHLDPRPLDLARQTGFIGTYKGVKIYTDAFAVREPSRILLATIAVLKFDYPRT